MKKTITLGSASRLKEELDKGINEDNINIKALSKQKGKNNEIDKIEELKEEKSTLLVRLTEAISEQNLKTGRGEKYSNTYHIKLRSEYTRQRKLKQELGVPIEEIKEIDRLVNELESKLSKFNLSHKVKVEISEELLKFITTTLE